jgi:hypothetical protein
MPRLQQNAIRVAGPFREREPAVACVDLHVDARGRRLQQREKRAGFVAR